MSDELAAARARKYKGRGYRSPTDRAREQAFADWLDVSLPFNEKKGVHSFYEVILQVLNRTKFDIAEVHKDHLADGWKRAAGEFISQNTDLISIKNGTAVVQVLQPSLRFHLNQWKSPLLEKLRNEFPQQNITTIKFIFG